MTEQEAKNHFSSLPKLYTAEEVAMEYHMNERYVRDEVNAKRLSGVKIANCWHFTSTDVAQWIESKKVSK